MSISPQPSYHGEEKQMMTSFKLHGIKACVFDAYGTLFDVNSASRAAQDSLGEKWQPLAELWRSKQLQYTWLRGLSGRHADFWQVTGDALDFALSALHLEDPALRSRLMNLYLVLDAYPEAPDTLNRLKAGGIKLAILSNGTPPMLAAAAANAGMNELFDAILSVEEVQVFKPHPSVYALACERLKVAPAEVCFISSNGWDAYSAKAFGFHTLWCNRFGQAPERIPETPDAQVTTLAELPDIIVPHS
jgi:2-haloacid dehalogenase